MWALAEIHWADAAGTAKRVAATIEDISPSGACLRLKTPIEVGSRLTVKWHREEFAAEARNCRSDGMEYLLGVLRDKQGREKENSSPAKETLPGTTAAVLDGSAIRKTMALTEQVMTASSQEVKLSRQAPAGTPKTQPAPLWMGVRPKTPAPSSSWSPPMRLCCRTR